jgi:hypothetical protein
VDVLKVQHHGSEHNMTPEFAEKITADNYVFCGNGFSGNPEPAVIDVIFNARDAGAGPKRKFKFWFNSSKGSEKKIPDRSKHMASVERQVDKLSQKNAHLQSFFLGDKDYFDLNI